VRPPRESDRSARRAHAGGGGVLLANLAARPFVNKRPVQRFAMAAWAISAVLVGVNIALWLNYRHESTALRDRLAATRAEIEAKSRSVVAMDQELSGLRLGAQNAQVAFLNERIAERTFPWSLLFERIASTLPDGVRLKSLSPVFAGGDGQGSPGRRRRAEADAPTAPEDESIHLTLTGTAKSDESLYELVDSLFAAPAFASPRLQRESSDGSVVEFAVDVDYRPRYLPEPSHRPSLALDEEATGVESSGIVEESSGTSHQPAPSDTDAGVDADRAAVDEVGE
jgi:Tfp pilus assembly protein PilN